MNIKSIDKVIEDNLDYLMCHNMTLCALYELQQRKYEFTGKREDKILINYFRMELYKEAVTHLNG
jgi:hypothetical protein